MGEIVGFVMTEQHLNELTGVASPAKLALIRKFLGGSNARIDPNESKDVLPPLAGSKYMPDPVEFGVPQFMRRTVMFSALWSSYFFIESERFKALVSAKERAEVDHSYEIGMSVLQPWPLEQQLAALAMTIIGKDDQKEMYAEVDKQIAKMVALEAKKKTEAAAIAEAEAEFHSKLFAEWGIVDLVGHATERLKQFQQFEQKSVVEYSGFLKAMMPTVADQGTYDWLATPVWAQAKIVLGTIDSLAFDTAIMVSQASKNSAALKYMMKYNQAKFEQKKQQGKILGELRSAFKAAFKLPDVKDEIDRAIDANRIKSFEIERLMLVLGE